ncbi:MAG TPA: RNA polymerase sigma factor [Candidatus Paceibacterota bacterium]|nr:RNA polymerase sigma factor [Candidatus Paceibacterota bacterium]
MAGKKTRTQAWKQDFEASFLAAYDDHADALFRHVFLRLRDREVATDVVQETFSRAWLYLSKGKRIDYMRAFLYRVANNLIVDVSRKKRSTSLDRMMEDDGFELRDEAAKDPAEIPQAREAMALLTSLDEIYRTVITMRFIEELSPGEIAQRLGVSENVVSVRIHRGIARLSKLMNKTNAEAA